VIIIQKTAILEICVAHIYYNFCLGGWYFSKDPLGGRLCWHF